MFSCEQKTNTEAPIFSCADEGDQNSRVRKRPPPVSFQKRAPDNKNRAKSPSKIRPRPPKSRPRRLENAPTEGLPSVETACDLFKTPPIPARPLPTFPRRAPTLLCFCPGENPHFCYFTALLQARLCCVFAPRRTPPPKPPFLHPARQSPPF